MVGWVQKAASLMLHTEAIVSLNLTSIDILYLKFITIFMLPVRIDITCILRQTFAEPRLLSHPTLASIEAQVLGRIMKLF